MRTELSGHESRGTAIAGGGAYIFGSIFMGIGVFILLRATNVITAGKVNVPLRILGVVGGIFFFPGFLVFIQGIIGSFKQARKRRLRQQHPDQPWLGDYEWNEREVRDDSLRSIRNSFLFFIFLGFFLVPFNWFWYQEKSHPVLIIVVGLFDLLEVFLFFRVIYLVLRFLKYGRSYLRFSRFPFFLGETIDFQFGTTRDIRDYEDMKFTLRCIEEQTETRGSGNNRSTQVVSYQIYAEEQSFGEGDHRQMRGEIEVSFPLPDAPTYNTSLSSLPLKYWEVEVSAKTPGIDYAAVFLVPVYAHGSD